MQPRSSAVAAAANACSLAFFCPVLARSAKLWSTAEARAAAWLTSVVTFSSPACLAFWSRASNPASRTLSDSLRAALIAGSSTASAGAVQNARQPLGQWRCVRWPLAELRATFKTDAQGHVAEQKTSVSIAESIHNGESRSFNSVPIPALAIYAIPQGHGTSYDQLAAPLRNAFEAKQIDLCGRIADEFQTGVPDADVLRIAHANHYVFISNQAEVLAAIEAFCSKLAAN